MAKSSRMYPKVAMASAVVSQAIKDLHRKNFVHINHHIDAICWLGSKASTKWFDAANIEQSFALSKLRWDVYARDILLNDETPLSDDQRKMLTTTLEYLQRWHKER